MLGVSVVIPCYNAAKYIRKAIQSVLDQQYDGPLEVIVADDASDDGSPKVLHRMGLPCAYCLGGRTKIGRPPAPAIAVSAPRRNRWWLSSMPMIFGCLGTCRSWQRRWRIVRDSGLVYDKGYYVSANGRTGSPVFPRTSPPSRKPDDLILEQCFPPAGVMVRRNVFAKVELRRGSAARRGPRHVATIFVSFIRQPHLSRVRLHVPHARGTESG